jgi:hypothetical protein
MGGAESRRALPELWLEILNTQAEITARGYRIMARNLIGLIDSVKLADLKVRDVQFTVGTLAERWSTRSIRLARMILIQAIRNAVVTDPALRNWLSCPQASRASTELRRPRP